jgi:ubiquinone/menaquinone biosynthesis C-methylase UbiE
MPNVSPERPETVNQRDFDQTSLDEAARRAARTYSAAADHYERPALGFWDRWGAATVARLSLAPGNTVLDLCCGAGGSAIPAACAVGPDGRVVGVDLAAPLLELARAKAGRDRLSNVEFHLGDATRTGYPSGSFDAVVCVFGVFFARDMPAFVAEMWRMVQPGGTLAITTWGPGWCEPASSVFWDCVRQVEPSLYRAFNPWDETTTPQALSRLFADGGIGAASAQPAAGEHDLDRPEDFWDIVLGSGFRATVDALGPVKSEAVRDDVLTILDSRAVRRLGTDVVFGKATKPPMRSAEAQC